MIELRWSAPVGSLLRGLQACHPERAHLLTWGGIQRMLAHSDWCLTGWDDGRFVGACWAGEHLGVHICVVPEYHRRWASRALLRKGLQMIRTKQPKIQVQVGTPAGEELVRRLKFRHVTGRHWELEIAA